MAWGSSGYEVSLVQVTLETKCWQADWKTLLRTNRLQSLAERNEYEFVNRVLMVNNVANYPAVRSEARRAVDRGLITQFVIVKDHADEALHFFELTPKALGSGYVYSIAELVSIFLCRTEFLLHFAGDCMPL